ncbi:Hypothetical predicted protein, partial [Paramuricea clavata]
RDTKSLTVRGTPSKSKSTFQCALPEDNLDKFIEAYNNKTNETLKPVVSKKPAAKSGYELNKTFRCHHNTRYNGTENPVRVLSEKPAKRFKNICCPLKMTVKKLTQDEKSTFNVLLK